MHRRVVVAVLLLALLALVAVGGFLGWRLLQRTSYQEALAVMPAGTLRATYTDWSQVSSLVGEDVDAGSSTREVDQFLERGYDADLTSTSAVADATSAMESSYGFSALTAEWEVYGQSTEGAVVAMRLPEGVDLEAVEENLREVGYDEPADGAGSGGVWAGTPDLVAATDPSLTPVFQNIVVLPDEKVVLMSDAAGFASSAAEVVTGDADGLTEATEHVSDLADLAEEPVSAVLFADDFACSEDALSMSRAAEGDQNVADQLVEEAGGVSPLAGLVMAHQRDRTLLVGLAFESAEQARDNLEPRVELATGEAVGQGGSFTDRFTLEQGKQDGDTVTLTLKPAGSAEDVAESTLLSDLSSGPVLFATC